ncbi:uncharacterized protein FIBRA_05487 [Fibroporia radiculosa]|uniref:EVE domain-containing protein n=1 Tax=Fibroporia radiculosa TaxID=599839 RepID=J4G9J6_9APHY|nr:uncharacterized protein FIBRA_05487 [Fibroporia radiculosa]CCM03358.1 predicted protein [Fibroporia radiculosa]
MAPKYWLMKAEPDSRIVKGKDVKFSVDDFEAVRSTPWEGVRNAEARNLMKEMKMGDRVLFYHSNCKIPGIAAFAEVDSHPYYDPKTEQESPKWYMVDVTFVARTTHFIQLALLRQIAATSGDEPPTEISYIGADGVHAIKQMALVTRGRLSVQRVEEKTWDVVSMLAEKGGWNEVDIKDGAAKRRIASRAGKSRKIRVVKGRGKKVEASENEVESDEDGDEIETEREAPAGEEEGSSSVAKPAHRKRKVMDTDQDDQTGTSLRRSTRARKK